MGALREEKIYDALRVVKDPDLHKDIVSLGFVENLRIDGGKVAFDIELTTPACPVKESMRKEAIEAVQALDGVESVQVHMTAQVRSSAVSTAQEGMRSVRNAIAIASGKGGVGKSTVATNLALALAHTGARVGLMDADVYGPSVPIMLGGLGDRPSAGRQQGWIQPVERHGIRFMSIGLLTGADTPVIWRGPMASKLVQQFLGQVEWGELDYLLIDLPPGTGDVQLTLTQSAPLAGAVIVTTPQDVAVGITMRGLRMFEQVQVPILGVVENMSGFVCSHCGETTDIFRQGGGRRAAEQAGVAFLGAIPIDADVTRGGDEGRPIVAGDAMTSPAAKAFCEVAGRLAREVSIVNEKTRAVRYRPQDAKIEGNLVTVTWEDGHRSQYTHRDLRLACPCAVCVDEWSGDARLDPKQVPADVKVLEIHPVGRYALQFTFSDGHATGLYSFNRLRELDARTPA
ncbi:MAG: P-loop NTPase [Acidobacteriota bacterium]